MGPKPETAVANFGCYHPRKQYRPHSLPSLPYTVKLLVLRRMRVDPNEHASILLVDGKVLLTAVEAHGESPERFCGFIINVKRDERMPLRSPIQEI